jgi:hypothetical protein
MEFASEMVIRASQAGLRITEVPIVYHPDARNRPPHLRPWRDGWRHLRFMLLYSPRWLFLIPGLALMAFGLFLMLWLLSGPRHVMGVRLDIHTMVLGSLFAVVGYQIVTIGLFAKIFALTESFENEDSFFRRAFSWFNLERGLLAGAALFLVGLVINVRLFFRWAGVDFGDLPAGITLRPALLASTLMILGAQTFFSSFFFSILGIARR